MFSDLQSFVAEYFEKRFLKAFTLISKYIYIFLGPHLRCMEVPGLGVKSELQRLPVPQPQGCQIQAAPPTSTATLDP